MMTFRWSWIFTLYPLLVRLGSAAVSADNLTIDGIHLRAEPSDIFGFLAPDPPAKPNIGAIVGAVLASVTILASALGWYLVVKRRKVSHVEEGTNIPWLKKQDGASDPKSQFSPDEKSGGKFDRLREALSRRGIRKQQPSLLPIFQIALPPGVSEPIGRPPPSVPSHVPRYPSVLERGGTKTRRPTPPPLEGYPDSRTNSIAESLRSLEGENGNNLDRRKIKLPPKALAVTTPGRPLPGLAPPSLSKSPGSRPPKSPSKRRSWFSKNPLKHPFIPVRHPGDSLRFPPGSPLHPGQYQPSRHHLEARKGNSSPLSGGLMTAKLVSGKESVRRAVFPQDPGPSKQARLIGNLQSAGSEGPRTPMPDGSLTALPHSVKRRPPNSARVLPDPPTTSHL